MPRKRRRRRATAETARHAVPCLGRDGWRTATHARNGRSSARSCEEPLLDQPRGDRWRRRDPENRDSAAARYFRAPGAPGAPIRQSAWTAASLRRRQVRRARGVQAWRGAHTQEPQLPVPAARQDARSAHVRICVQREQRDTSNDKKTRMRRYIRATSEWRSRAETSLTRRIKEQTPRLVERTVLRSRLNRKGRPTSPDSRRCKRAQ
ncbi:hypothetical protein MRX96_028135 [Rhipicephalus microplus]